MNNASNSSTSRRHSLGTESSNSRFYLHHHAPDHISKRTMNMMRRVSSVALHHVSTAAINPWKHGSGKRRHSHTGSATTLRVTKQGSASAGQLVNSDRNDTGSTTAADVHSVIHGHALVMATCSRLRLPCETCQHSVHKHRYLYCQHCPLVCHNKDICLQQIPRGCPGENLGIEGWGESRHSIRLADQTVLDMEEVFLSGMLGLQSHKCYECGRLLNPNYGHEYPARRKSAVEKVNGFETRQTENSITVPNKSQRRNSSANLTQDACAIRACHLTGKYYCERCHWNDQWYIPGSIFLLNDMSLQPMCRSAYLKIRVLWDAAIFRIPAYWHQENAEAAKVFEVRSRLHQMLRYTLVCAEASALKEFAELTEPAHLLGYPNYMRMADVINILNGTLHPKLQSHLERWMAHINSCEICLVNGRPTDLEANVIRSRHRNSGIQNTVQ